MIVSRSSLLPLSALALLILAAPAAVAQSGAVRVLASNGVKGAMDELQSRCERETGHALSLAFSSTAALKKRIEAGEPFDVTIITSEAISDLVKQGKIAANSRAAIGYSELGIGIRAGTSKPDIRTTDALKQTLRQAKSITFPRDGATRGNIEQMFERLGIATEIQPRIILAPSSGAATASVAGGKAALVITLFSEIVPVHGLQILGPLPGQFRHAINFEAAAGSAAKDSEAAKAVIAFLAGPKAAPAFKAKGVDRR